MVSGEGHITDRDNSGNMSERLLTREFGLDTCVSLCCSLNYYLLLISLDGFCQGSFHATAAQSGIATGIYVIGGMLTRIFLGKYVELVGRRRMLLIGLGYAVVMSCSYFFISSLTMLYVIRFRHGMAYGVNSTCTGDIIAKIIPASRRGEGLGYFYLSITASMAIGPFLGMMLAGNGNYELLFAIGLMMYVIAFVLALMMRVPEETLTDEQKAEAKRFNLGNLFQFSAVPLGATSMVFYLAYSGVLTFISAYSTEIGLAEEARYFFLVAALGTFISRLTTGRIYDRHGANIIVLPAFTMFMMGMYFFATTGSGTVLMASGFFIGYSVSIVYSVCQAIVVSRNPAHRYGVTTSTFGAVVDLGTGLGPSILGIVVTAYGYRDMYMLCVGIALVSLMMYWMFHGRIRSHRTE